MHNLHGRTTTVDFSLIDGLEFKDHAFMCGLRNVIQSCPASSPRPSWIDQLNAGIQHGVTQRYAPLHLARCRLYRGERLSQPVYETITSTIMTALRKGVVPWRKPWHVQSNAPVNAVSNKAYRGVNVFLLGLSEFRDHRWLTLKQVGDLGGKVIAGQKATMVVFWKHWEPKETDPDASSKRIPILRYYHVFNVEQCECLKLASLHEAHPLRENERIERADLLVRHMLNPPTIQERGNSAWYRPADDLVQVPPISAFDSADAFYGTLFHELGHSTGHVKRLNRAGVTGEIRFGSSDYSKEELVAELTAAFCCATVSLDNRIVGDAASYINGWLNALKNDPKSVVIAAAQAQKAADYIRGVTYQ